MDTTDESDTCAVMEMFHVSRQEAQGWLDRKPLGFLTTLHEIRSQIFNEYKYVFHPDGSLRLHERERLNIPSYVAKH